MSAQATTMIDDERVRVTIWTFSAGGESTGLHVHEYDYIVVPVTGGTLTVTDSNGVTHEVTQRAGAPYFGSAGTEHDVANVAGASVVFVDVELKQSTADLPRE